MRFLLAVILGTGPFAAQAEPHSVLMRGFTGFTARAMAGGVARLERVLA
jgi:hypothetical protein